MKIRDGAQRSLYGHRWRGKEAEEDKERDGEMNYKPTVRKPTGTERQETVNYGEVMLRPSSSSGLTTAE